MKFKIKIGQKEFKVEILELTEGVKVKVNEKEFLFEEKAKEQTFSKSHLPKKDFSQIQVLAPISGEITKILVKEGDFVKKDQTLLFLSAMKMENEILAEKEGKVKKILVKEGQKVEKDQVLILLE